MNPVIAYQFKVNPTKAGFFEGQTDPQLAIFFQQTCVTQVLQGVKILLAASSENLGTWFLLEINA